MRLSWRSLLGFLVLPGLIFLLCYFLTPYFTIEGIQQLLNPLHDWVSNDMFSSSAYLVLFGVITTSLGLPFLTILALLSGFLFPFFWGLLLIGSIFFCHCLAMVVGIRYLFSDFFSRHLSNALAPIYRQLNRNAVYTVIFLRLSLITPSAIINCACAFSSMNPLVFAIVSLFSSLHVMSFMVYSGKLLSTLTSLSDLYSQKFLFLAMGLSALSLIPVIMRRRQEAIIDTEQPYDKKTV